ncbi:unnamed protein product [Penicillium viridicatum]
MSYIGLRRYLINAVKLMKATTDRIGDPDNVETKLVPLADKAALGRVEPVFTDGETHILTGGKRLGEKGCFFDSTVLCNPDPQARVYKVEVFGPVTCVRTFKPEVEFVEIPNDAEYGLMVASFTKDTSRVTRLSTRLEWHCGD